MVILRGETRNFGGHLTSTSAPETVKYTFQAYRALVRGFEPARDRLVAGACIHPEPSTGITNWVRLPELRNRIRGWYERRNDSPSVGSQISDQGQEDPQAWRRLASRYGLLLPEEQDLGWSDIRHPYDPSPDRLTTEENNLLERLAAGAQVRSTSVPDQNYMYFEADGATGSAESPIGTLSARTRIAKALRSRSCNELLVSAAESYLVRNGHHGEYLTEVIPILRAACERSGDAQVNLLEEAMYKAYRAACWYRVADYIRCLDASFFLVLQSSAEFRAFYAAVASRTLPTTSVDIVNASLATISAPGPTVSILQHYVSVMPEWLEPEGAVRRLMTSQYESCSSVLGPRIGSPQRSIRHRLAAVIELSLTDIDPGEGSPISSLSRKTRRPPTDLFFQQLLGYWLDVTQASRAVGRGLWLPTSSQPAPTRSRARQSTNPTEVGARPPMHQVIESLREDSEDLCNNLRSLSDAEFYSDFGWIYDSVENHEVALSLSGFQAYYQVRNLVSERSTARQAAHESGGDPVASLYVAEKNKEQLEFDRRKCLVNYIHVARRAAVVRPDELIADEQFYAILVGLNIVALDLVKIAYRELPILLAPIIEHLDHAGFSSPYVSMLHRCMGLVYSKFTDFGRATKMISASDRELARVTESWKLSTREVDEVHQINQLEGEQLRHLFAAGTMLRRYEEEVIRGRRVQQKRERDFAEGYMSFLRRTLKQAKKNAELAVEKINQLARAEIGLPERKLPQRAATVQSHINPRIMLLRARLHTAHFCAVEALRHPEDAKSHLWRVAVELQVSKRVAFELSCFELEAGYVNELLRFALHFAFLSRMQLLPLKPERDGDSGASNTIPDFLYSPHPGLGTFDADKAAAFLAARGNDAGILASLPDGPFRDVLIERSVPRGYINEWNDDSTNPFQCWQEVNRLRLARRHDLSHIRHNPSAYDSATLLRFRAIDRVVPPVIRLRRDGHSLQ